MSLDSDHAFAVLSCSSAFELPKDAVSTVARREGLDWISLDDGGIDVDVPIPLIFKVEAWFRFAMGERVVLAELWGEAYDRSYGARVCLLGTPPLEVFSSPPRDDEPPERAQLAGHLRWERGVGELARVLGREIDPARLMAVMAEPWPGPLAEIWVALLTRY